MGLMAADLHWTYYPQDATYLSDDGYLVMSVRGGSWIVAVPDGQWIPNPRRPKVPLRFATLGAARAAAAQHLARGA